MPPLRTRTVLGVTLPPFGSNVTVQPSVQCAKKVKLPFSGSVTAVSASMGVPPSAAVNQPSKTLLLCVGTGRSRLEKEVEFAFHLYLPKV